MNTVPGALIRYVPPISTMGMGIAWYYRYRCQKQPLGPESVSLTVLTGVDKIPMPQFDNGEQVQQRVQRMPPAFMFIEQAGYPAGIEVSPIQRHGVLKDISEEVCVRIGREIMLGYVTFEKTQACGELIGQTTEQTFRNTWEGPHAGLAEHDLQKFGPVALDDVPMDPVIGPET